MVAGMRNLRMVLSLVGISIFALLILDFVPGNWLSEVNFAEGSVNYLVMGLIFFSHRLLCRLAVT